ncbi:hypothetical protein PtA15_5A865 [Puccinia triticina]|uniref:Uncharacterized protein n=1 Tax=Puccinia triticina TaxID=208348 RepID=A0ABY7CKR5_9BASI|nr:uncharacterized protein PtA15_5A865 [Puccinia triticina]WAQ85290.1 hypothetical protein PtA15_5A865 [Puccinia triticina]
MLRSEKADQSFPALATVVEVDEPTEEITKVIKESDEEDIDPDNAAAGSPKADDNENNDDNSSRGIGLTLKKPPQHRPRPPKNNFSSPASAFNTLATGLGRITQGKIGISPDRSFDYAPPPPPESFTLIPCRPSLTTQNSGDGSSAASHYGGASSTSISYDLSGWCAAVLSVLCLPEPAGNNSTTSRNETATEEAGGLIGRDKRKPAPAVRDIRASVRASSYWQPGP